MTAAALVLALSAAPAQDGTPPARVHSVCDISQEFTFYMDGRFYAQYLREVGRDARNWGSLHRLDLSNTNLLVLTAGDARVPYTTEAIQHVDAYVRAGGTLLLMADGARPMPPGAAVAEHFGAHLTTVPAEAPLASADELVGEVRAAEFRGGTALELGPEWRPLLQDAGGRPVLAHRTRGEGWVLVGSRGLFGQNPDASDPINAGWVTPLLVHFAAQKAVDTEARHRSTWAEHERQVGPLTLEYHDGTAPFADGIAEEYLRVRPHLVAITGVEPSPGMIKRLLILPTGGGGFSSGERIAIGAWWGGYPERRYPMVELIAHEAGHSWVLPHPEPLWNEPIATYLGVRVGQRLGMPEADETLARQLAAGRRHDPDYTAVDPLAEGAPRDLVWGKSFFVFEELERRFGPGALARYFRAKRGLLEPGRRGYSMDDCVAVWSRALGEDLFPWFRSLAFDVRAERSDLAPPPPGAEDDLDLVVLPLPAASRAALEDRGAAPGVLSDPDWHTWGGSVLRDDAGRYHLFHARWPRRLGFTAWLTHSEIAHAVADEPGGPYRHVGTALGGRGGGHWDAITAHNPKVARFEGRYYLYYIGTHAGDGDVDLAAIATTGYAHGEWRTLRENQRTGVAVADALDGPWERRDKAIVEPAGPIVTLTVNPAVARGPDGTYLMIVKGDKPDEERFVRNQALARAPTPTGPFTIQPEPVIDDRDTEDASLWYDARRERFYAVFHEHDHIGLITSTDGRSWAPAAHPVLLRKDAAVAFDDGARWPADRLERPYVLRDAEGEPSHLFVAVKRGELSANLALPLAPR